MGSKISRRNFLKGAGVTAGAVAAGSAGVSLPGGWATAQVSAKIPTTPLKFGYMTFLTGPAAVLGEPMIKGHLLAAEEINAKGGVLGKRQIETIKADEAAGTDANVKELRRMKLSEKIDLFGGITSSGNTPALGPVAEELGVLTLFVDGCTDFLFDKAVTNPHFIFRMTNIQSADGATAAIKAVRTWKGIKKVAHIHPDYSYGRNAFDHFNIVMDKLVGNVEMVSEAWPKLGTTDFAAHITKTISSKPDLLFTSVWGGDYVAMYKQMVGYGLYDKMKVATTLAFGVVPHALGKDHPEGIVAGVHSNYHFTHAPANSAAQNKEFVTKYLARWKEYPNFQAEGAYTALNMYVSAVERSSKAANGAWPETDAVIAELETAETIGPAGHIYVRKDNHQAYKDCITGLSARSSAYPFPVWDLASVITIPIKDVTAPANWPKPGQGHNDPTATYNWIKTTWPKASA
jgi:branched-chain amino acid transport system substrate-binding protein